MECKFCKSDEMRKRGIEIQSGKKKQRWQCKQCGKISLVMIEEIKKEG